MSKETNKTLIWLGLAALIAVYVFARLWNLAESCLFFDEIFGVHAATHGWLEMFSFLGKDLIHPPLFYIFLKIWIIVGGESVFWLRLFSVFWSVLAIVPFLLLCRELNLKSGEMLTAFAFVAVNGALIRYAQELRMYSMLFCLSLVSLWLFVKLLYYLPSQAETFDKVVRLPKEILRALFIVNLLLVYTHYFGWLVVLAELIALVYAGAGNSTALIVIQRQKRTGAFFVSVLFLFLCFVPWLVWVIYHAATQTAGVSQNLGWAAKPGVLNVFSFFLNLHEPFYYRLSTADSVHIWAVALPCALIGLGILAAAFADKQDEKFNFAAIFVFAPIIAAFVASWILPYSVWGARHLIIIFAPFAILLSVALWSLPIKNLKYALLAVFGVLILAAGALHFAKKPQVFIWCGWRELAAKIEQTEPATIYVFEDDNAYQLWYAVKNNPQFKIVSIDGYADMPEDAAYFLPRGFDAVQVGDKTAIRGEKFWLAFREKSWKPDKQVLRELTEKGYKINAPLEFRAQGVSAFLVEVQKIN